MPSPEPQPSPLLIIVMGVSGSGKTTLAKSIANRQGYQYVEADNFHSKEAIALMSKAIPLTDDHRQGWIARLQTALREKSSKNISCTLAFSGLKSAHRAQIQDTGFNCLTIYLNGDREVLRQRLLDRTDHFMPASLLDSQFDALQPPEGNSKLVELDIKLRPHEQLEQAISFINTKIN